MSEDMQQSLGPRYRPSVVTIHRRKRKGLHDLELRGYYTAEGKPAERYAVTQAGGNLWMDYDDLRWLHACIEKEMDRP